MIRDGGSGDRGYEEDRVSDAGADTSSSDGSCSTGFHSEESLGLEYGSEGSELSQLLDEEVNRVKLEEAKVVEEMDISLSSDTWHEDMDEVVEEEKGHDIVKNKTAKTKHK